MLYARYLCSRDALGRRLSAPRDDRVSCIQWGHGGHLTEKLLKKYCSYPELSRLLIYVVYHYSRAKRASAD